MARGWFGTTKASNSLMMFENRCKNFSTMLFSPMNSLTNSTSPAVIVHSWSTNWTIVKPYYSKISTEKMNSRDLAEYTVLILQVVLFCFGGSWDFNGILCVLLADRDLAKLNKIRSSFILSKPSHIWATLVPCLDITHTENVSGTCEIGFSACKAEKCPVTLFSNLYWKLGLFSRGERRPVKNLHFLLILFDTSWRNDRSLLREIKRWRVESMLKWIERGSPGTERKSRRNRSKV